MTRAARRSLGAGVVLGLLVVVAIVFSHVAGVGERAGSHTLRWLGMPLVSTSRGATADGRRSVEMGVEWGMSVPFLLSVAAVVLLGVVARRLRDRSRPPSGPDGPAD